MLEPGARTPLNTLATMSKRLSPPLFPELCDDTVLTCGFTRERVSIAALCLRLLLEEWLR
eukprot:202821-Lingulodinium_polyedra.AAC.1